MIPTRQFALGTLAASMLLASQAATAEITDNEIRIGYLADMTGAYRDPIGPLGEEAIRLAIEERGGRVAGAEVVSSTGEISEDGTSASFSFDLVEILNPDVELPESFDTVVRY